MADAQTTADCCFFYQSTGGAFAGGCTKDYLEAHHGDFSGIHTNGAVLGSSASITIDNDVITDGTLADAVLTALGQPGVAWTEGGILAYVSGISTGFYEIVDIQPSSAAGTITFKAGSDIFYFSAYAVYIGGMHANAHTLAEMTGSQKFDTWLFVTEDITVTGFGQFINPSNGNLMAEQTYSTFYHVVGCRTNAFEFLPGGWGYWDESIVDDSQWTSQYKPALEKARIGNDIDTQALYSIKIDATALGDWQQALQVNDSNEGVRFMGLVMYTNTTKAKLVGGANSLNGTVHIRHCAVLFDDDGQPDAVDGGNTLFQASDMGGGGTILDNYCYRACLIIGGNGTSLAKHAEYEIAYNVCDGSFVDNVGYYGMHFHHNIIKDSCQGVRGDHDGSVVAHNNLFYCSTLNGFMCALLINGVNSRASFYNNIICVDRSLELDATYNGFLVLPYAGGELSYWDHNLICDLSGDTWPVNRFVYLDTLPDWRPMYGTDFGLHDILNQNPLFVDPDNWDFRLRSGSPCLFAGRPDLDGKATHIGVLGQMETCPGLYGQPKNLYGI